ncbi:hypothetical protein BGY98DRAFT_960707 [Russula aff. rugulosa BPL654]|nr:hypothetical protein BGY98DRAFT_960707 [Russula aff. rugulosa BPL654]
MVMSSIFALPSYLWNSYVDYLWNYDSNSWVATVAYAFRIWAILAILPTLVLALLVKSPSGIISTKPTTSASSTPAAAGAMPSRAFFVDAEGSEDDGAARLAGVGVFSPVASMPGSPTVSRRNFFEKDGEDDGGGGGGSGSSIGGTDESGSPFVAPRGVLLRSSGGGAIHHHHQQHHQHHQGGREAETEQEQEQEQEHGHSRSASDGGTNGSGSTSGESSFAILDREESFEDTGVHIRRRVPGAGAPGGAGSSADE